MKTLKDFDNRYDIGMRKFGIVEFGVKNNKRFVIPKVELTELEVEEMFVFANSASVQHKLKKVLG